MDEIFSHIRDACCGNIYSSCEKECENCFRKYVSFLDEETFSSVLSLIVEWNLSEWIDILFEHREDYHVDINKKDPYTRLSLFEKACMSGNKKCIEKFLTKGYIGTKFIFCNDEISTFIQEWNDTNGDLLDIKQPEA